MKKTIMTVIMIAMITSTQFLQADDTEPTKDPGQAYLESAESGTTLASVLGLVVVVGGLVLLLNHSSSSHSHSHS